GNVACTRSAAPDNWTVPAPESTASVWLFPRKSRVVADAKDTAVPERASAAALANVPPCTSTAVGNRLWNGEEVDPPKVNVPAPTFLTDRHSIVPLNVLD